MADVTINFAPYAQRSAISSHAMNAQKKIGTATGASGTARSVETQAGMMYRNERYVAIQRKPLYRAPVPATPDSAITPFYSRGPGVPQSRPYSVATGNFHLLLRDYFMKRLFSLLPAAILFSAPTIANECTMNIPQVDTQKLTHAPDVTAFTLRNASDATVLMKDGRVLYIHYSGCSSAGMQGVLWLPRSLWAKQQLPDFSDSDFWRQQAIAIADYLFDNDTNKHFRHQLATAAHYKQDKEKSGFSFEFTQQESESTFVSAQKLPAGVMISVEYIFRG